MLFQADVETDEVYAQMTLQPLTPVRSIAFFFSSIYFLGFIFDVFLFFSSSIFSYRKNRRIHFFQWSWEFQASSQPIISARHWQQVILVPMVVFLFLVVLLRKSFLHWYSLSYISSFQLVSVFWCVPSFFCRTSRSSHQLRNLLQGISMTLSGNLDISLEVSFNFYSYQAFSYVIINSRFFGLVSYWSLPCYLNFEVMLVEIQLNLCSPNLNFNCRRISHLHLAKVVVL